MDRTSLIDIEPYRTKDGSIIRELMHPSFSQARNQSLAEARVAPGSETAIHRHAHTEEIYHVTGGLGVMILGEVEFGVEPGDTVLIPPGTPHGLRNIGERELVVLCCCSPAYSHEDTLLEDAGPTNDSED